METSKDKKKYFKSKDKKGLMNTWDDLNDTSSDEEGEEEANICIMVETTSEESKSDQDDEVDLNDLGSLKKPIMSFSQFYPLFQKLKNIYERTSKKSAKIIKNLKKLFMAK